jgi:DNA-binding response OmpR family regulator
LKNNSPQRLDKQKEHQIQESKEKLSPFAKRILIVDDDPDITYTFKKAFEEADRIGGNKTSFHVDAYNDPLVALSEFKSDFYDLLLIDIDMPKMNGFDFCVKVFELDLNPKVCFIVSAPINQEALRDQYPSLSIGCFIETPVTIDNLIKRVNAELE